MLNIYLSLLYFCKYEHSMNHCSHIALISWDEFFLLLTHFKDISKCLNLFLDNVSEVINSISLYYLVLNDSIYLTMICLEICVLTIIYSIIDIGISSIFFIDTFYILCMEIVKTFSVLISFTINQKVRNNIYIEHNSSHL